ncbi:hypothetical protein [Actinacidiphila rubida]|uniref:Uncharacterized protein n=1 Tax=Actinacidiphila rubida TaxID=310780 RepID=A0A1H8T0H5_9ACTN|nr:hypothetical protein [Actinacidiphila rubida]SEO84074.1 hypothetical protein SAMN05216267_104684 [Actinacidiphila rubida]
MTSEDGALTRDAEVIDRLPREPLPVIGFWNGSRGQDRALTIRLSGREQRAVATEEYAYPDGRTAYRIRPADADGPMVRVWWDDAAMRWGWLGPGRDGVDALQYHGPGEVRRRWWDEGHWPMLWVHRGGRWREAWLHGREDWPDGTVVYLVGVEREGAARLLGLEDVRVTYDPRAVQPRKYLVRADGSQA